jgi:hypothetical protein
VATFADSGRELDLFIVETRQSIATLASAVDDLRARTELLESGMAALMEALTPPPEPGPVYGAGAERLPVWPGADEYTGQLSLAAGTSISGMTVFGDLRALGPVHLDHCILPGGAYQPTTDVGVVTAYNRREGLFELDYCTIKPHVEAIGRNGILGWQYAARHCEISGVNDGVGWYATSNTGSPDTQVLVEDTWIHDLIYGYPDTITTSHKDGPHTDGGQGQGGRGAVLRRVKFDLTAHALPGSPPNPEKPWLLTDGPWANGACVVFQDNTKQGQPELVIEDCEFAGGLAHLNIKPGVKITLKGVNRHHDDVAHHDESPKYSRYYIRFDNRSATPDVTGLETCVFVDGPYEGRKLLDVPGAVYSNA